MYLYPFLSESPTTANSANTVCALKAQHTCIPFSMAVQVCVRVYWCMETSCAGTDCTVHRGEHGKWVRYRDSPGYSCLQCVIHQKMNND